MCLINAKNDVERMKADIRQRAVKADRTAATNNSSKHVGGNFGSKPSYTSSQRSIQRKQSPTIHIPRYAYGCRRVFVGALLTTALKVAHHVTAPREQSAVYSCLFTTK